MTVAPKRSCWPHGARCETCRLITEGLIDDPVRHSLHDLRYVTQLRSLTMEPLDFSQFNRSVGAYNLGGVGIFLATKPSVFHRAAVKLFFGWAWVDNPAV